VIPEEILTDHPQRFRAMIVESSNPLHSLADSKAFREAFTQLDMTLVIDVAMTETAALANWVLPASSTYEKAEATFFPMEFPDNFFHLRRPLLPPLPGTLPEAEIHARLVEALGVFDPGELKPLEDAAKKGLDAFAAVMLPAMMNPKISSHVPYVLYRTLGPTLPEGTDQAASLWGLTQMFAMNHADLVHAAGIEGEGPALGNNLFSAIVNGTSGVVISRTPIGHRSQWRRPDGKILLAIPEMNDELDSLKDFRLPARPRGFPLLLAAGQRRLYTANTIIRDPDWMKSNNPAALTIHPADATRLGFTESARARLITERGEAIVSLEFDDGLQEGTIALPNGLGLSYPDAGGNSQIHGVSLNELTSLKHRDPWVGTPLHKHVPARLERIA
jgi:anaerobic selenocysteine-containing dehydrogenase